MPVLNSIEFDECVFPGLSKETTPSAQLRLLETLASQPAPPNSISLSIAPEDSDTSQTLLPRHNTLPTPPVANSNPPSLAALPAPAPFLHWPPPLPAVPPPAPQPPAPLVPPAPPAILRQSQRKLKKAGEWWKVPRPALHPYKRPQRAPSLTPDPIPASPLPVAPVVLPEPAPAPQLVPPVDNWEPQHPSPAIADSDDSDNNLGGYAEVHAVQVGGDPRTFKQAMASPQAQHWEAAAADEILTLIANGTWELVELPPREKAIPSGWVFRTKQTSTGDVERYKGRVVAKGCSQRPGIDYDDTYSPTFRPTTLRTTLAAAGIEDMELCSVDDFNTKEELGFTQVSQFEVFGEVQDV
ncbi:hypothetical protein EST38_g11126 [Candolleomyces aberdarensis]|uniref:Reverse transcriptase Ty1/copia-type domain-containing protein n=1 Tax=Candolleomyces aberdarensis TaxID=2316362 RepID=A0A4V1Q2D7_9AGAR|nr:hypothetical protein EST38_g11126 [Candolleomyces aberdarensis]